MMRILHLQSRRPHKWRMLWLFLMLPMLALASPNATVTGTVIDSDGFPLIGVNVVVKNTTIGTTTDLDGNYSIDAPEGAILEFSYIGFQTIEEPVGGRSVIDITMRGDSELLDEVVVVGYGVQRKSDLTGSVAQIDGADLQNVVVGNAPAVRQTSLYAESVRSPTRILYMSLTVRLSKICVTSIQKTSNLSRS